ncbi:MAG TPA: serine/threonine-protein kinase [Kofleriaceae bacterium]|nr:serine/threonine-protein kinase [Kofleriaceae bacterium]
MTELPATFGKYYLTEKIAAGGMAEIYLAKLLGPGGFEKQLVIKQIHPELTGQPQFVDLFVTEAKTLVSLTHGNIVPVYELGMVADRYFIAMEYIDGPTLSELLRAVAAADDRVAPPVAAYICAELLKGLDYAHRKGEGVIHRDLSPRNVMLSREGEVKLVDFGIAVALDDQPRHGGAGRPEGSFPYMSPEQVRSEKLTGQSDLFSVGVLLWESLTGLPLFVREDADQTLRAVVEAEIVPPSQAAPGAGIDPELDAICMRALARDPAERFATASELLTRLSRYLYSLDVVPSPAVLSRLVARHCPPAVRAEPDTSQLERTMPAADDDEPVDRTVPVPRNDRPRRASTHSFATSVQFEREVLSRATPLFPLAAIRDEQLAALVGPQEPVPGDPGAKERLAPSPGPDGRRWFVLALGAAALGAALLVILPRLGSAPPGTASNELVADAAPLAPLAPLVDASVPDAGPEPTGADAGSPDARPVRRRPDAASTRGTGTLEVGANPWAEVYLGGKKLGRAPGKWSVPAGKHVVLVRFPVPGREQEQRFPVTVTADGVINLGTVDFTDR